MAEKVPEAARGPLAGIIDGGVEKLNPIVEKLSSIPGVGPIIKPFIDPLMDTLSGVEG